MAHLNSSPQSAGLEPKDLVISFSSERRPLFSSESLSSTKFLVKKPREGSGRNNCPAPKGFTISYFFVCHFSGLRSTWWYHVLSLHLILLNVCTASDGNYWNLSGLVAGGGGFRTLFDPHITGRERGKHLPRCSWQLPPATSLCLLTLSL